MKTNAANSLMGHLRRAALRQDGAGLTDGELLELYVARREEAAFEALVRRHGPMVLGVCRRVLRNEADSEDAFQATFLVFVQNAASIRSRERVSNWLYGVAHNTALKAKAMARKRHVKEREARTVRKHEARAEVWQEVQTLLDAELSRLPDKYRVPIVLCDLEGKTIKEAARHLGWPQGTVATRLTRGRAQLAKRLAKRGLTLSGGVIAAALSQGAAPADLPTALAAFTIKAVSFIPATGQDTALGTIPTKVAVLTEAVMKTMMLAKLKIGTMHVLAPALIAVGLGLFQANTVGIDETKEANMTPAVGVAGAAAAPAKDEPKHEARDSTFAATPSRDGELVTEEAGDQTGSKAWNVPPFDEISVSDCIKVIVIPGPMQRLTARGDAKLSSRLRPRVEKKPNHDRLVLELNLPIERADAGSDFVEVRIVMPRLSGIIAEGNAVVDVRASKSDSLGLTVSGTAKIEASGATRSLTAIIHDSGQLHASKLAAGDVSVTASGKSSSVFHPEKSFRVFSSGESRVEYVGNPAQLNKLISGRSCIVRR